MARKPDKVRDALELLERERADVLAALEAARRAAQQISEQQKAWRDTAATLLERGDAVGLSVKEMAKALGLSRQWTTHLRAAAERRTRLLRVVRLDDPPPSTSQSRKKRDT